ncbi:MAG: DNA primase [Bdellovibrionales bacterium]
MYSQDFIEKVRDSTNIVELLSQYTELKKSGSGLLGLCPFPSHREKTPSFSVSELKQVYYCFGCGKNGNAFTFLKEYQGMSFPEAIEFLADRASIPLPVTENFDKDRAQQDKQRKLYKINQDAAIYYHRNFLELIPTHPARAYASKRGLTEEMINTFMVGYSSADWDGLLKHLKSLGHAVEQIEELGLCKKRQDASGYYDLFRDRLMFPILSTNGHVVGFGGRSLTDDQMPKYLNSSESPVFSKGRTLYGLNETSKYLKGDDFVFVVEGYMDFLALYSKGIKNVVAVLGTALTSDHSHLLRRFTKNTVLLFDGDSAGQKAVARSLPILLAEGMYPKSILLPNKMDPDDFVHSPEHGAERLRQLAKEAPDLFLSFFEERKKAFGTEPSAKVRVLDELGPILKSMKDLRLRDLYVSEMAKRFAVDRNWIQQIVGGGAASREKLAPNFMPRNQNSPMKKSLAKSVPPKEELLLLNLSLWKEKFLKEVINLQVIEMLSNERVKHFMEEIVNLYGHDTNAFATLTSTLISKGESQADVNSSDPQVAQQQKDSKEDVKLFTLHLNPKEFSLTDEQGDKLFADCLIRLRERHFKGQAKALLGDLKAQKDPEKLEQFVNMFKRIQASESDKS